MQNVSSHLKRLCMRSSMLLCPTALLSQCNEKGFNSPAEAGQLAKLLMKFWPCCFFSFFVFYFHSFVVVPDKVLSAEPSWLTETWFNGVGYSSSQQACESVLIGQAGPWLWLVLERDLRSAFMVRATWHVCLLLEFCFSETWPLAVLGFPCSWAQGQEESWDRVSGSGLMAQTSMATEVDLGSFGERAVSQIPHSLTTLNHSIEIAPLSLA